MVAGAHRVHATQQLTEPIELIEIAWLRCAAATSGEEREAETAVFEQRLAVTFEWRNDWDLAISQLLSELMLLEDRFVAPATGPIELRHDRRVPPPVAATPATSAAARWRASARSSR